MVTSNDSPDAVRRERDALREAILRHRAAQRPSARRQHDDELYAALTPPQLRGEGRRHLTIQESYFDSPY